MRAGPFNEALITYADASLSHCYGAHAWYRLYDPCLLILFEIFAVRSTHAEILYDDMTYAYRLRRLNPAIYSHARLRQVMTSHGRPMYIRYVSPVAFGGLKHRSELWI